MAAADGLAGAAPERIWRMALAPAAVSIASSIALRTAVESWMVMDGYLSDDDEEDRGPDQGGQEEAERDASGGRDGAHQRQSPGATPVAITAAVQRRSNATATARALPRSTAPIASANRSTISARMPRSIVTTSPLGFAVNGARCSVRVRSAASGGSVGRSVRASDAGVECVTQAVDRSGRSRSAGRSRRNGVDGIA